MPGEMYSQEELAAMTPEDFEFVKGRNFLKPAGPFAPAAEFSAPMPDQTPNMQPTNQINLGSSVRRNWPEPRNDVWSSGSSRGYDFTCPSGQTCRIRKLQPEELLQEGLLDKVSRLEGLAQQLVDKAEGVPPSASKVPTREELGLVLGTMNSIVPLAVVEPQVYPDNTPDRSDDNPNGVPENGIRCRDIDLGDRMAILNETMSGVLKLDSFRNAG